jgi:hypothetical protein
MSYSCSRHQWYSPVQPCNSCSIERHAQYQGASSNQQAAYARMQAQARWPEDVFKRLEGERDAAVKLAATYRVALEKASDFVTRICATHEGDPEPSEREAKDLDAYIIQALGGSPSGSEGER